MYKRGFHDGPNDESAAESAKEEEEEEYEEVTDGPSPQQQTFAEMQTPESAEVTPASQPIDSPQRRERQDSKEGEA